uniref:DUF3253 domain-containing protein n=1 Tax=Neobodo designis TaxID=312471 RepID=A0A7S1KXL9_NEODS|mmetsp:Transcript_10881/g.33701  ORF Transcript_10881/g.33701 Transcript_10881/m.33701 type:complete len:119 (+) Transcript_10881:65-421(+)
MTAAGKKTQPKRPVPAGAAAAITDDDIERMLFQLLAARRTPGATMCPSEVARALAPDPAWRALMEPVRRVARRLAISRHLVITQRGTAVDPHSEFHGPIRLRSAAAQRAVAPTVPSSS